MYKFKVRPGYQSSELLIDFNSDETDDLFFCILYESLKLINVSKIDLTRLWVDDEVIFHCDSDLGKFEIIRDEYGSVFIIAPNNKRVIKRIGELLDENYSFSKQNFNPTIKSC